MPKKTEADDLVTYLLPALAARGIDVDHVRIDQTTSATGNKRGDVWISRSPKSDSTFERDIVALIEAKHRNATISSADWRDAMAHGRLKANNQKLTFYIVTNCNNTYRYYNAVDDSEIVLDGDVLTKLVSLEVLEKIAASVSATNSFVIDKAAMIRRPVSELEFQATLRQLANVYRAAGIVQGDDRIDPTVGFVVLKYISEKEAERRTLPPQVKLWDSLAATAESGGDLGFAFRQMREMLWGDSSEYRLNQYRDFKDLVSFPSKLLAEHFRLVYEALNPLDLHGASFDVFGSVYEEFASQTKKKEFGEFYTRRHITGAVARLLLRNETRVEGLKIVDPACGTGGFLTEAFKSLRDGLKRAGKLNDAAVKKLREDVFWGFDNDKRSVARTKLNMFLVGDGHMHVYDQDSITDWGSDTWMAEGFDYVFTNPPMGRYQGSQDISSFEFTNEKRMELLFTERVVKATKPGGEIAIVLNDGSLEAPTRADFRQKLLEYCEVKAVVSLTKFAFAPYTKEKTYVLFLQRKQEDHVGTVQTHPIWHYIVDYDGYANSDKRYRTKYHDDLPELMDTFPLAMTALQSYGEQTGAFEALRTAVERPANDQEALEGVGGLKSAFIPIAEVNAANYYNLLSEFHLRPAVPPAIPAQELRAELTELTQMLSAADAAQAAIGSNNEDVLDPEPGVDTTVEAVFDVTGGNSGLTEELIYENWPLDEDDAVHVLSGATGESTAMGVISKRATPGGRDLKTFDGPALVVARKGKAGTMQLVGSGAWAINDDAYVLTPKEPWAGRIDLNWARTHLEPRFKGITTSNSDNATLSKEYLNTLALHIPALPVQERAGSLARELAAQAKALREVAARLERLGQMAVVDAEDAIGDVPD